MSQLTEKQKSIFSRPAKQEAPLTVSQSIARTRAMAGGQAPKVPDGFFSRAGKFVAGGGLIKKPSEFLFGTVGKTVGKTILSGVESVSELATGKTIEEQGKKRVGFDVAGRGEQPLPTVGDIAFTALELYPGGGFVTQSLKKVPGGIQTLKFLANLPETMKKKAIQQYASIFGATSKESKALVKKVVPELLERKEKILSTEKLVEKAEGKVTKYGEKIDQFFEALPANAKEQTKPILDKLVEFKNKFTVEGKIIRPEAIKAIDNTMEKISQFGKEISSKSARKMRQIFDEHFSISKGIDDISVYMKKAERAGADAIRAEFAKTRPILDNLNKEFSFWTNVLDLGTYSTEKSKSRFTKSISSVIGGVVGFQAGEGIGGKTSGAIIGAYLGTKAIDLMRSPAWKSISAIEKNKLADAIMKADIDTINLIITKMTAGIKNIATEE